MKEIIATVKGMMAQDPQMQRMAQQNPEQFEIMFEAEVAKVAAQITQELVQTEMQTNAAKQDPLVRIKQQEVDLKAMDMLNLKRNFLIVSNQALSSERARNFQIELSIPPSE